MKRSNGLEWPWSWCQISVVICDFSLFLVTIVLLRTYYVHSWAKYMILELIFSFIYLVQLFLWVRVETINTEFLLMNSTANQDRKLKKIRPLLLCYNRSNLDHDVESGTNSIDDRSEANCPSCFGRISLSWDWLLNGIQGLHNVKDYIISKLRVNLLRPKKMRSHYCRECCKTVEGFDHHCIMLNTCIGSKNYGYFVALLFVCVFKDIFQLYVGAQTLVAYNSESFQSR